MAVAACDLVSVTALIKSSAVAPARSKEGLSLYGRALVKSRNRQCDNKGNVFDPAAMTLRGGWSGENTQIICVKDPPFRRPIFDIYWQLVSK